MPADRTKDIFSEALLLQDGERTRYLDHACRDDASLRRGVEDLLSAHDSAGAFMAAPTSDTDGSGSNGLTFTAMVEGPGSVVGDYRLIEVIGEGGFGKVFVAEQIRPVVRRVAVKILKPGMDSEHVIARFEAERQALALMDHPGISKVFDAGATAMGRPFVVMELVDGRPLTAYCDEQRLTVDERLHLFEKTCLAVQHAHQKGVIHRDLKPTNVLVTVHDGEPVPKIIDFGIAKAITTPLTDRTLQTGDRQLLGTPQYMSPEQAGLGGDDVDTRSDIYALGVMLYELLSGALPFDPDRLRRGSLSDIQQIICHERPRRPSTRIGEMGEEARPVASVRGADSGGLRRRIRGDLDWIVLKTLEKDRRRRYATAGDLAAEIRRVLRSEPIEARPPSSAYLLSKFIARHRVMATAAVFVAVALVGGLVVATVGLRQASTQRDYAEESLLTAEDRLWDSYLAQARASRASDRPGRRFESLEVLGHAAEIRTAGALRDEAIACMTLSDVRVIHQWNGVPRPSGRGLETVDRIACRTADGEIGVVDSSGETIKRLEAPAGVIAASLFSPDARYLMARFGPGGHVVVWDLETSSRVVEPEGAGHGLGIFDPTSVPPAWVAIPVGPDDAIQVYDLPGGRAVLSLSEAPRWAALAVDPTGSRLAAGGVDELVLYDLASAAPLSAFEFDYRMHGLDWSDDGRLLAAACGDMFVRVLDVGSLILPREAEAMGAHAPLPDDAVTQLAGHGAAVVDVEFAPGSRTLASYGWDNTTRLWDVRREQPVLGPIRGEWLGGFSDVLVTFRDEVARLWQFESGSEYVEFLPDGAFGAPRCVDLAPDGTWLVTAGSNGVRLWATDRGETCAVLHADRGRAAHVTPRGDAVVAVTANDLRLWKIATDDSGRPFAVSETVVADLPGTQSMTLTRDGAAAVVVTTRRGVLVIDLATHAVLAEYERYGGIATPPSLSSDGRWIATGNWSGGPARVRDTATGATVIDFTANHVAVALGGEPEVLVVGLGAEYRVFATGTWEMLYSHSRDNADNLAGPIEFAPDGRTVALTRSRYQIDLLDLATGRLLATLESPSDRAIGSLSFDASGTRLATATMSGAIQIWNIENIRAHLRGLGLDWIDRETAAP